MVPMAAALALLAGAAPDTLRVPEDVKTIQAAIDRAADGDTVLIAPGIYKVELRLRRKSITLASRFIESGSETDVRKTILEPKDKKEPMLLIEKNAGPKTRIVGLTFRNGGDAISCEARVEILNNVFTGNKDTIDYEGGGGICRGNLFEKNRDDGIDLDGSCAVLIENNVIRDNRDDGIEVRLHKYSGPTLEIVIRNNVITGNREDGIQLIDYPDRSDRTFRIERNLIARNAMAGIGCMGGGNTGEDYEAADLPEPVLVVNNTFADNEYGITGGDAMIVVNNVFLRTKKTALKKVDGGSIVAHALFWENGRDSDGSNLDAGSILRKDPMLGKDYRPADGSPCVDAGTALFEWKGKTPFASAAGTFSGKKPDLGAFEFKP